MPHGHEHGSGGGCGGCAGEHDHEPPESGVQYSLYEKIDTENLQCLNEAAEGSGRTVFKPWEARLDLDQFVESDADEELLFNIPFTGNIKLKGIVVIGENSDSHPSKLKVYKNRPNMTFDEATSPPDQVFDMQKDTTGTLEYSTKIVTFSSVTHLTLHFPTNFGADSTKIYYIGLRGEFTQAHRHGVTICTYEARPNVTDHKLDNMDTVSRQVD